MEGFSKWPPMLLLPRNLPAREDCNNGSQSVVNCKKTEQPIVVRPSDFAKRTRMEVPTLASPARGCTWKSFAGRSSMLLAASSAMELFTANA